MSDLKPCPFCGGQPKIYDTYNEWRVICSNVWNCGAKTYGFSKKPDAVNKWNTRAESQELTTLRQQNAELVELAKYCVGFLGSSDALDSMALHSITHRAHELISKTKGDKDA